MKKRYLKAGIASLIMSTMLTGCGASKYSESAMATDAGSGYYAQSNDFYVNSSMKDTAASYDTYEEMEYTEEEALAEGDGNAEILNEQASNRKLIRNVAMDVETEQFDELMATIEAKTKAVGGYIENSYTYNGRSYYSSDKKNANLTIRIPAENLDTFLSSVADQSNVTSKNENVSDVTLQYVDLESHKKTLKAEQDRLLEMIEKAETVEDMITIESRLSEVRYQLESQEAQLRTFDNQINYSTVNLNVSEVTKYTPPAERTFWEKISEGFADSLEGVITGLVNFVIWFIVSIPYLVIWAIIIGIVVNIIVKAVRNKKERKVRGIDRKTQKAEHKALKKQKKEAKKAAKESTKESTKEDKVVAEVVEKTENASDETGDK